MKFPRVQAANALPIAKLEEVLPATISGLMLAIYGGMTVPKPMRDQIWDIYQVNMRPFLQSLDRLEKETEWFHPHARLLILTNDTDTAADTKSRTRGASGSEPLVAYGIFRFDTEENEDGGEDEVLYCYELQVASTGRRRGIGSKLVDLMEMFGARYGMKKTMLTCFKENATALAFYMKLGFLNDPICPSQWTDSDNDGENEDVNYVILSKPLVQGTGTIEST